MQGIAQPRIHRHFQTPSALRAKDIKEIPVASYAKDQKPGTERTTISVDQSKAALNGPSSEDVGRKAVAFDSSIVSKMTPTVRSFTLEGKVAVVTGYVQSCS